MKQLAYIVVGLGIAGAILFLFLRSAASGF
jgi:hypothetical protein